MNIKDILVEIANGNISVGIPSEKLPPCPKCGKHRLQARKGWQGYDISCWRSCGFGEYIENDALKAIAHQRLARAGALPKAAPGESRRQLALESDGPFTPSVDTPAVWDED